MKFAFVDTIKRLFSAWRRLILGGPLVLLILGSKLPAATLCSDFQVLLKDESPIRYFKIGFSNVFRANQKPIPGWIYYEGSIQPNTFWIRNCTNSPMEPAILMPGWVVGHSDAGNWSYSNDRVSISPKNSTPSPLDARVQQVVSIARQAFGLGVATVPGSFKLFGNNDFEAEAQTGGMIAGHFDVADDGRPMRCEYSGKSWPKLKATLIFGYKELNESNCFPSKITYQVVNSSSTKTQIEEYELVAMEFGAVPLAQEGYTIYSLTNLPGINLKIDELMGGPLIFNGDTISKKAKDGKLVPVRHASGGDSTEPEHSRRIVVLLCLIALGIPFSWFIIRAMIKQKQ